MDLLIRFIAGGIVVSSFAILGDCLKPKSFAGLLGAAPSVALATISLAVMTKGRAYAATESESMILGAIAFFVYAALVSRLLLRNKLRVIPTTAVSLVLWLGVALGSWYAVLR